MGFVGKTIAGYKIEKRIGKGGMGSVYLGKNTITNRSAAIKVVNLDAGPKDEMALRFQREAKLHALVGRHSNIIYLINYLAEDNHYIFLEYFESVELGKIIGRKTGPIPHERAIPICKQILSGISRLHEMGMIHRDIKPSNILINKQDDIKIADFGIAKEVSSIKKKKFLKLMQIIIVSLKLI